MMKKNGLKNQKTKEMGGEEPEVITKTDEVQAPSLKIRCLRTCDMPGVGQFNAGEVIEDQGKIARIADNPNFEVFQEENI